MKRGELIYETKPDRGFIFKAWEWESDVPGDALIEVERDGKLVRSFRFPSYKVWNIAYHTAEIIDSELKNNVDGYGVAASFGLGGS